MSDLPANQLTAAFARRLRADTRFMSYVLATYQQQEGLSEAELARYLGAAPELLTRLALCRRPSGEDAQFAEQVRALADYALIDEATLANLLRQVESLERLAQVPATAPAANVASEEALPQWSALAAARDREESEAEPPPTTNEVPRDE